MRTIRETLAGIAAVLLLALGTHTAQASIIVYEDLPTANSNSQSFHNITGPVLADDFTPAYSGNVVQVDWWGTLATSPTWEITFHTNNINQPAVTLPTGGISQHFVTAVGADPDGDGIYYYTAAWTPPDVYVLAGADYWFSVANALPGWNWANTTGIPTVGSQQFNPVVSVGASPSVITGPHDGPWTVVGSQDFAFRILVDGAVPAPATLALLGLGLTALGFARKRG